MSSKSSNKVDGELSEAEPEDILEFDGKTNFNYKEFSKDNFNSKVDEVRETLGKFNFDQEVIVGDQPLEYRSVTELENKTRYDGEWIEGQEIRQGRGRQIWHDGSLYEGWFKDDKRNGKGRHINADG